MTEPENHAALDALPDRVRVVRQKNAAVCWARHAGLALVATGYAVVVTLTII